MYCRHGIICGHMKNYGHKDFHEVGIGEVLNVGWSAVDWVGVGLRS